MNRKSLLALIVFAAASLLPGSVARCFQDEPSQNAPDQPVLEIIRLEHAPAPEIADLVRESLPDDLMNGLAIIPDSRSNSLIITASGPEVIERVRTLLESLDVVPQSPEGGVSDHLLKVFPIAPERAQDAMAVLQTLFAGKDMRMQADASGSQIVALGPAAELDRMAEVLEQLGAAGSPDTEQVESVYISFTLVVEGSQATQTGPEGLTAPPDDLAEMLNRAREQGLVPLENPLVATHSVSRVRCGTEYGEPVAGHFSIECQRPVAGYYVTSSGDVSREANGQFIIECQNVIDNDGGTLTIASNIVAQLNHPVLLSFTSIGNVDSALIVRVTTDPAE